MIARFVDQAFSLFEIHILTATIHVHRKVKKALAVCLISVCCIYPVGVKADIWGIDIVSSFGSWFQTIKSWYLEHKGVIDGAKQVYSLYMQYQAIDEDALLDATTLLIEREVIDFFLDQVPFLMDESAVSLANYLDGRTNKLEFRPRLPTDSIWAPVGEWDIEKGLFLMFDPFSPVNYEGHLDGETDLERQLRLESAREWSKVASEAMRWYRKRNVRIKHEVARVEYAVKVFDRAFGQFSMNMLGFAQDASGGYHAIYTNSDVAAMAINYAVGFDVAGSNRFNQMVSQIKGRMGAFVANRKEAAAKYLERLRRAYEQNHQMMDRLNELMSRRWGLERHRHQFMLRKVHKDYLDNAFSTLVQGAG